MTIARSTEGKNRGGRPAKYAGPSRPVTMTLPESTLEGLKRVDPDRGRAVVKLTAWATAAAAPGPTVDVVEVADRTGLIVIGPSAALRRIPFLHLVEVAPARFLLALVGSQDFRGLEIAVADLLEELPPGDGERPMLVKLLELVRRLRKSDRVSMAQILFVRLEGDRPR